ncbi:hypothetical protein HanRHA438_Chr05g0225151 [Helianthus annuus]|nr:hypothetical protein HanIR_Chr05g0232201 [Helianthus annuus]KAJ0919062.1 hypothetical protein HanRHA438_Chr05g0225151 [Helianthus annuus]
MGWIGLVVGSGWVWVRMGLSQDECGSGWIENKSIIIKTEKNYKK